MKSPVPIFEKSLLRLLIAIVVCSPSFLQGAAYIRCVDQAPNVVCSAGGSLDLTTATIGGPGSFGTGFVRGNAGGQGTVLMGGGSTEFVTGLPAAPPIGGSSTAMFQDSSTGGSFGFDGVTLQLPDGTTAGILDLDALNITSTFNSTTVAGLGLTDNTTTTIYSDIGGISGNDLTFHANTPIPEPSSSLLLGWFVAAFLWRRRR